MDQRSNTLAAEAAMAEPKQRKRSDHARRDVERILINQQAIAQRVEELAQEVRRDLDDLHEEVEIVLVPILTGALIFVADLIRQLPHKVRISVATASSYRGKTTSAVGEPIVKWLDKDLHSKHVLIVDDILDSGTTIRKIREELAELGPKSVHACVLLRKRIPSAMETPCEYVGFDIDDEFVVGYGLDYNGFYRNLPDICVLKEEAL